MSRDRLEDLGRLTVLIEKILTHPFFHRERILSNDYLGWFESQPSEKKREVLDDMIISIEEVEELEKQLQNALDIAKGIDPLNG
jgi:hypothetical protein